MHEWLALDFKELMYRMNTARKENKSEKAIVAIYLYGDDVEVEEIQSI